VGAHGGTPPSAGAPASVVADPTAGMIDSGCVSPTTGLPARDEIQGGHPRLVLNADRLCALRRSLQAPGGVRTRLLDSLTTRLTAPLPPSADRSEGASRALGAALLYVITGDRAHATTAYEQIQRLHADPSTTPLKGSLVGRARIGAKLALTFDWAFGGFTAQQRATLAAQLDEARAAWQQTRPAGPSGAGSKAGQTYAQASELLQILALRSEVAHADRMKQAASALATFVQEAPLSRGVGQTDDDRLTEASDLWLPAAYALDATGDDALLKTIGARPFWRFALVDLATSARARAAARTAHIVELALLFDAVEAREAPAYRAAFDQKLQPATAGLSGWSTAALVWALLMYPEDGPRGTAPDLTVVADPRDGAFLFHSTDRSVAVSVLGGYRNGAQSERVKPLTLGIRAFGVTLAGAPPKRSGLLVDGRADERASGWPVSFASHARGGHVVMDGLALYPGTNLSRARRHVLVEGRTGHPVIVSTLDQVRAAGPHGLQWQIAPEATGLTFAKDSESGRRTFVVRRGETFLKGWVLHPPDAHIRAQDRVVVKSTAANEDLWVVMVAGKGTAPAASFDGQGLDTRITIEGGAGQVRYDRSSDQLVVAR
jgi:hypothetical protein